MEDKYTIPYEWTDPKDKDYTRTIINTTYGKYSINPIDLMDSLVPPRGFIPSNISTADADDIRRGILMKNVYENSLQMVDVDNFKPSIKYLKDIKTNKIYKITIEEASLDDMNNELDVMGFKQF